MSAVITSTTLDSEFAALRRTEFGTRLRSIRHRHPPAMWATVICSAQSVAMLGRESRAVGCICVPDVAGSRDYRKVTALPNDVLLETTGVGTGSSSAWY